MLVSSAATAPKLKGQRSCGAEPPANARAKITNDPARARANRNTAQGRRVADLYRAFLRAMGNPDDAVAQANALAAAELKVAAEDARKRMLDGDAGGDPDQLVRLENLAHRAERKLGIKATAEPKPPSLAEHLARHRASEVSA
jgi:hypothetical protein